MIKYENLYDYQKSIIDKLNESKLLLMSVSTGKTVCSIYAYKKYANGRLLITCPASMVKEWTDTVNEFGILNVDIYSYNKVCMENYLSNILKTDYDCIIIDEAHHISNRQNKSTKKLLKKIDDIRLKYLLTATPENYKWQDFYTYFRIIKSKSFMTYKAYRERYFVERPAYWNPYCMDIIGYINEDELFALKDEVSLIYQKTKKAKVVEKVCDIPIETNLMNKLKKICREKVYKDYIMDSPAKNAYFKRMLASSMILINDQNAYEFEYIYNDKISKLNSLLQAHKSDNIIVYYNYINEKTLLKEKLTELGYKFTVYENKKDCDTLEPSNINLISYSVGSEGINKFRDCTVYIAFSLPYSKRIFVQSKGRINRLDNYDTEYYYYFINQIDASIYATLKKGQSFTDKLMSQTIL